MITNRVLLIEPGKRPCEHRLESSLESWQKTVDGDVQCVPLGDGVDLMCDENGKFNGKEPNREIFDGWDVVFGTFFLTRVGDDGNTIDLTDDDVAKWSKKFAIDVADTASELVTVEKWVSDEDGKVVVRIGTSDLEDIHPSDDRGPTNLRVVLNDDYDNPLWEN